MSQSILYILNQKSVRPLKSFQNGWGTAPALWDYLAQKYLGWKGYRSGDAQKLWDLVRDDRLSYAEKICHMMTFDRFYIPRVNLEIASDACLTVYADMPDEFKRDRVNHWYDIDNTLSVAQTQVNWTRHARDICMSCTTVADEWRNNIGWYENAVPIFKEQTS